MSQVRVNLDIDLDEWLTKEAKDAYRTKSKQVEWFLRKIYDGEIYILDGSLPPSVSGNGNASNIGDLDKENSTSIDTLNSNEISADSETVDDNTNDDSSYKSNEEYIEGLSSSDQKDLDTAAQF